MASGEVDAQRRNDELVTQLESTGILREPAVAAAFRAVLRHRFLPSKPLDEVYEDSAIMTKVGEAGLPVSSSSQPTIMAIMLQLLDPRPGQRVLEIGAGTGYNAALIAHLVGPRGRVVTVEIDPDLAERARANLAGAGVGGVEVALADGAGGWIVTAAADDLSAAWADQLVDGGRLVLPLALGGPGQLCAAFARRGRALAASQLCQCGFMPLRGGMAPGQPAIDDDLARWLDQEGRQTGHVVPAADVRAGFESWLGMTADGYIRTRPRDHEIPAFGLRDARGTALLVGEGDPLPVLVYGDGDAAALRLVVAHQAWARDRPALDRLRIFAFPRGEEPAPPPGVRVVRRPHFTFLVRGA